MTIERENWLKLTFEDPIDPALPICDPHHHLFGRPRERYFLEEFLQDLSGGHNVLQTVYIASGTGSMYRKYGPSEMRPVGETEFAQGIAAQSASGFYGPVVVAAGIVGFADLTLGAAVVAVLEAQMAASPNRFRGIRQQSTWDASPAIGSIGKAPRILLDPKFRKGFGYLHRYGLSFDAWLYFTQLPELTDLATAFPDISVVLNHTGGLIGIGPYVGRRDEVFQEWKRTMTALALCPNVTVKLGGLGMARCGFGWHEQAKPPGSAEMADAMAPYFLTCIELFGTSRCMFESNFPIDKISFSYTVLWNAFKRMTQDLSPQEKLAIFHDNAARVYRLPSARDIGGGDQPIFSPTKRE